MGYAEFRSGGDFLLDQARSSVSTDIGVRPGPRCNLVIQLAVIIVGYTMAQLRYLDDAGQLQTKTLDVEHFVVGRAPG